MLSVKVFFQKEPVFCISLLLALASCLLVHPDWDYLAYPDYRTLALLFCLMIVVAGFQSLGVFALLGRTLLRMARSVRRLSLMMVALCFFCSMVITNDVTLITFVPFTMLVFRMIDRPERLVRLVVLETVAANLGSMATPHRQPAESLPLHILRNLHGAIRAGGAALRGDRPGTPAYRRLDPAGRAYSGCNLVRRGRR